MNGNARAAAHGNAGVNGDGGNGGAGATATMGTTGGHGGNGLGRDGVFAADSADAVVQVCHQAGWHPDRITAGVQADINASAESA